MYLNPFRDFIRKFGTRSLTRQRRRVLRSKLRQAGLPYRGQAPFTVAAEICESRTLLSGPQLIQVQPNVGQAINIAPLANTELVADPQITQGGCRVETRFGVIDQQFEAQLARIEDELA